jgi:hypothetical protein
MKDRPQGIPLFASRNVTEHLLRGVAAVASFSVAITSREAWPLLSGATAIVGMLFLRGCPACWTIGLVETIARRFDRS